MLNFYLNNGFYYYLALILLLIVINRVFIKIFINNYKGNEFVTIFFHSIKLPIDLFIILTTCLFLLNTISVPYFQNYTTTINLIFKLFLVTNMFYFIFSYFTNLEQHMLANSQKMNVTLFSMSIKLLKVVCIFLYIIIICPYIGINITGILTFGAAGSLVLGLAAKDLLANFLGGFMLLIDTPFKIGDWVIVDHGKLEGVVEKIGWRLTLVRDFESRPVHVPNSMFTNNIIVNPSNMSHRRFKHNIGLRYTDAVKVQSITDSIKDYLKNHDEIAKNKVILVDLIKLADSWLELQLYAFIKNTNWQEFRQIQQQLLCEMVAIIEAHGAEISYPTSQIKLEKI